MALQDHRFTAVVSGGLSLSRRCRVGLCVHQMAFWFLIICWFSPYISRFLGALAFCSGVALVHGGTVSMLI